MMMKYFKNLKKHPGITSACFISVLIFLGALTNKNIQFTDALMIGGVGALIPFVVILFSNSNKTP
jgi:hypothetical protein